VKGKPDKITIKELLDLKKEGMLSVNHEYQRGAVWTISQKKKLVDSVLRGYPIPLIYLHHIKKSIGQFNSQSLEVIDGQQRINSLYEFKEGAFKLFDPIKDDREARFPDFIRHYPCTWGGQSFDTFSNDLKEQFLSAELAIVYIETTNSHEARDLFVRLQAGMPLNAQEKRDAWPGQFTEFILKLGGKPEIPKYPGHEFFNNLMKGNRLKDRGRIRQTAAQIAMLYFTRRSTDGRDFCTIKNRAIDDFYYKNLDFDGSDPMAQRLIKILDILLDLLDDKTRKKIIGHEAIHLVLMADSLMDDYTLSWHDKLAPAFDDFRANLAEATINRDELPAPEYWAKYGVHARTASDMAKTIHQRHQFFLKQMFSYLDPQLKDPKRLFGPIEREIIYYLDKKKCCICNAEVLWDDMDIHHINAHSDGGTTKIENGILVHRGCHPKGSEAKELAPKLLKQIENRGHRMLFQGTPQM